MTLTCEGREDAVEAIWKQRRIAVEAVQGYAWTTHAIKTAADQARVGLADKLTPQDWE